MKRFLLLLALLAFGSVNSISYGQLKLKEEYDRFKDRTLRVTPRTAVDTKQSGKLEVAAFTSYEGSGRKLVIALLFYSRSDHTRFSDSAELLSMIDGERVALGASAKTSLDFDAGRAEERATFVLTRDQLSKLASASSVEMQIYKAEFRLKKEFIEALRALLERLPPETSRAPPLSTFWGEVTERPI